MKKIILIFALLVASATISNTLQAQHINVNINIGSQPAWGPVGYDYVDYYYMPDIDVYYIVNSHMYVYPERGRWVTARYLPYRYRNYDLYGMYKVVLVGGPHNPWIHNSRHHRDYGRYRNYRGQTVIRDSRDHRYRDSRRNTAVWYRESPSPNRVRSDRSDRYYDTRPNESSRDRNSDRGRNNNVRPSTSSRERDSSVSGRNSRDKNSSRNNSSRESSGRSSSRSSNSADYKTVRSSDRR